MFKAYADQVAVLKKPLQTSIAVEADEFDDIDVEDKLHIVISVKDFRAIIQQTERWNTCKYNICPQYAHELP